ncbi:hypothetical protein PNOK_0446300 [Pyrrhoderma noxium]|uniref:Uncharacterized protein n=1 Tax=Pyrrhoderma noxium TaxID=2282107 RepID=A0A286UJ55_9AGAM|nr:hypothetical protein PNOK_0446300 [Pyrrhoderma noxium]
MDQQTTSPENGRLHRGLPVEILAEIFEYCLPSSQERQNAPLHTLPPLTLSWVCKLWRELCLSLPKLWTTVTLGHRATNPADDISIFKLWLSRSKHLPISINLHYEVNDSAKPMHFDPEKNGVYTKGMKKLIKQALTSVHRWRKFEIHTLDISVLKQIFVSLVIGAPQLEELGLSTRYLGFFGDVHIVDFALCPALRTVRMLTPMICPATPANTMENMTTLELRFCTSIEDCLQWVDICPALEQLSIRLFCSQTDLIGHEIGWRWSDPSQSKTRYLPKLQRLEMHGFSRDSDLGPLIDVLDVPALKSLHINMYDMVDTPTRWTHVIQLVRRSKPDIEQLSLLGTPMLGEDFDECLKLLPNINSLAIGCPDVLGTDDLLKAMVPELNEGNQGPGINPGSEKGNRQTEMVLCPSLRVLDLSQSSWSLSLLVSAVLSRAKLLDDAMDGFSIKRLKELKVHEKAVAHVLANKDITRCIEESGLHISAVEPYTLLKAYGAPQQVFV